ncbi:MAG TPA: ABC transporter permease [Firmicutes bacterium]|nr:ABC transporter permease [Bacillota bacterium]
MTVGIVQLPGMMTGQITSGARPADPDIALPGVWPGRV